VIANTENFDGTALFALPGIWKDKPEEHGLEIRERPELITAVRDRGVDVHVIRGNDALDTERALALGVARPEYDIAGSSVNTLHRLGDQMLQGYGVLRTYVKMASTDNLVVTLNPTSLRALGRDKFATARTILQPLDLYRECVFVPADETYEAGGVRGSLVAKPNCGFASEGLIAGEQHQIAEALKEIDKDYIVEERLIFDKPMPGVRGRDEAEQRKLQDAYDHHANTELRMYSFGVGSDWYPGGRISEKGVLEKKGQEWVIVDDRTVPQEVYELADKVRERVNMETGSQDTIQTVDFVFAGSASQPEHTWQVMEINAEPYVIRTDVDMETGLRFRNLQADQIARIAKSGRI